MEKTLDLLSLLYELSLANTKHKDPRDTAEEFIRKFLARKSFPYGAIWNRSGGDSKKIYLDRLFSVPNDIQKASIDLATFKKAFKNQKLIVTDRPLINESKLKGHFAYFLLKDAGIFEIYDPQNKESLNLESLKPFEDVVDQLASNLESGYAYLQLQKEIEQREAAQNSLKTNEEKFRRIINNIKMGLLEVDNEEIIQHANTPFLELTGYELHELIGKKATEVLLDQNDPESLEKIGAKNESRKEGQSDSYELKILNKRGEPRWAIISGAPNYDEQGNHIGSIGIHMDITEEKKLREENEFKSNQLEKLFEKSLDALISITQNGEVFEWNHQAEAIFGYTEAEIIGQKLSDTIIPHHHREGHKKGMKNFLKTGHGPVLNSRIEITGLKKSGEEFPIELTIFPLKFKDYYYFTAFIRDISEIKESKANMERALKRQKELNDMKSQFISMTSHELRTPLTTIKSNTELINHQVENPEYLNADKLGKNVKRIENNVERLNNLISNILLIGKLDSKKIPFNPESLNVSDFLKKKIIGDFASRGTQISFAESGKRFDGNLDKTLFSHIINNLIENAIKYTHEDAPPEIELNYGKDGFSVSVKDHGIGIPKDEIGNLFDTFFRASNVDNIQGTGLGLSIVHEFVKLHNGEIEVESELGAGTTFTITFPKKRNI